jgi:hypothetical protein
MSQDKQSKVNNLRSYKDKYTSIKEIYSSIRKDLRVKSERGTRYLEYGEYYAIVEAFLDEMIHILAKDQEVFKMPFKMGELYIQTLPHKRAFHVRVDHEASKEKGELVFYKVPILDDTYKKVSWDRPYKYGKYKVLPLRRFKELIHK